MSVSDVISILSSLDSGKATGCDELSLRFLKACPAEMGELKGFQLVPFQTPGNVLLLLLYKNQKTIMN